MFIYEDFLSDNMDFLERVNVKLGLSVDLKEINFLRQNMSYSGRLLTVTRFLNIFTKRNVLNKYYLLHIPQWYYYSNKLIEYLNKKNRKFNRLTPQKVLGKKNIQYIKDRYITCNWSLRRDFDLELPEGKYFCG